jgi:hypothetical protein
MPDLRHGLAEIRTELSELNLSFERLRQQRRDEIEAAPAILTRLTAIERALGLIELPRMPRLSRRRPLDA